MPDEVKPKPEDTPKPEDNPREQHEEIELSPEDWAALDAAQDKAYAAEREKRKGAVPPSA